MRVSLTIAAFAVLGLAACDAKPAADSTASPSPTSDPAVSTAAAPAAPAAAAAIEGPAAGKWRMTMTSMGQTLPPRETCYANQVSFAEAEKMQQQAGVTCSEQSYRRDGDAFVGHSVCTMDAGGSPVRVTTDTRITGDLSSKYTMDMTSKMDPPPAPGMTETKMSIISERIGDC